MGCLLKIFLFIPKILLKIVLFPIKQLFCCLMTLLTVLIILAAVALYFYKKNPEAAEKLQAIPGKVESLRIPEKVETIRTIPEKAESLRSVPEKIEPYIP
ncbi:MAG: hypothetical protein E7038_00780 [Lentisphaerae bacterium]|nr:hypothetical protein [Lentisphaerota bacterium]